MLRAVLFFALLLSLGCGASDEACPAPESGSYRVVWLTPPPDCPFLKQAGRIEVVADEYACFWPSDDACSPELHVDASRCGYAIANGYAVVGAAALTRIAPNRFRGPATAWVNDLAFSSAWPSGRRCADGGTVELVLDRDYAPPSSPTWEIDYCDPDAGDCPAGMSCRGWPGTPWGSCAPDPPPPPQAGQACLASCASGLVCRYAPGELPDGLGSCRTPALAGEPCGDNVDPANPYRCDGHAYCDEQGMCRAHPALGEACVIDLETCLTEPCISDAELATCFDSYCAPQPKGRSVCRPHKQVGEACALAPIDDRIECDSGLLCTCVEPDCVSGVCQELRFEGEPCDESETLCYGNLQCVQGVCR